MIKAIFIDIDGTLRNNNKEITERTKKAIENIANKGILVIITSGRNREDTKNISKESMTNTPYIISSNGGEIYNYKENKAIYINKMRNEVIISLYHLAQENDLRIIMNAGKYRVVNKLKHTHSYEVLLNKEIENFVQENEIPQCVISSTNFDKIKEVKRKIEKIEKIKIANQHRSLVDDKFPKEGNIYIDISNSNSSKGEAVLRLCEYLNIDLKDTIAIGDSYNDISMFKVVGYSVAMENSLEEVKMQANEITKSNKEDGVAVFLEKLLINL